MLYDTQEVYWFSDMKIKELNNSRILKLYFDHGEKLLKVKYDIFWRVLRRHGSILLRTNVVVSDNKTV